MVNVKLDGTSDPNTSPALAAATESLSALSYTLNVTSKKEMERDCVVAPLESLSWSDDTTDFAAGLSAQILQVGSYQDEFYLGDPRKTAAAKPKTLIRQRVRILT